MKPTLLLVLAAGLIWAPAATLAQDTQPAATQAPAAKPAWSDPEFEAIGRMLSGSFQASIDGANGPTQAVLSAAPVAIGGMTDVLYAEVATADAVQFPYRQMVWQLHRFKGEVRLKTLEFRRAKGFLGSAVLSWAAPQAFPGIAADDLVTTMEISLTKAGGGYTGKSACVYPTTTGGAVEMTNEIKIDADTISLADRGMDASGKVVWGPKEGAWYGFKRIESPAKVTPFPGGLFAVDVGGKAEGEPAKQGQNLVVHYIGYVANGTQNGTIFDSSYERGTPFEYAFGSPLIEGWNTAMKEAQKGLRRRLFIPSAQAYGERGRGKAIPPNSNLVFDIEVIDIKTPPPPPPPPAPPAAPSQPPPDAQHGGQPAQPAAQPAAQQPPK